MGGQHEVLMNSSENVGQLDLNNMQRFLRAVMTDWMFSSAGAWNGVGEISSAPITIDRSKAIYCQGDSAAPYPDIPGGVPRKISTLPGPLVQWTNASALPLFHPLPNPSSLPANWGSDVSSLVYWTSPDELSTTHAIGDATNPRWDLVCVKLTDVSNDSGDSETRLQKQLVGSSFVISSGSFVKRRKVVLTKQVVQGTPAASPVMPSVPAGFLPYYAVRVPAAFDATFVADDNFHDYRMPLGSFSVDVPALLASSNSSPYTVDVGNLPGLIIPNSGVLDFTPNVSCQSSCRLVGVNALIASLTGPASTVTLRRMDLGSKGTSQPMGGNSTWALTRLGGGSGGGTTTTYEWEFNRFSSNSAGNDPPTASVKPPWGTGLPSGYASSLSWSTAGLTQKFISVRFANSGSTQLTAAMVRFFFAGMPY